MGSNARSRIDKWDLWAPNLTMFILKLVSNKQSPDLSKKHTTSNSFKFWLLNIDPNIILNYLNLSSV